MTDSPRRIRVGAIAAGGWWADGRWWWEVGTPAADEHSIVNRVGQGSTLTRWGAVRAAKRRLRQLDRQARRLSRGLTINLKEDYRGK